MNQGHISSEANRRLEVAHAHKRELDHDSPRTEGWKVSERYRPGTEGASPDDPESTGPGKAGKSKLDPYKEWIDCRLGDGVWNAVVLYREVQELGYPGEIITLVRNYVRPKRSFLGPEPKDGPVRNRAGWQIRNDWGRDQDPDWGDGDHGVFFR